MMSCCFGSIFTLVSFCEHLFLSPKPDMIVKVVLDVSIVNRCAANASVKFRKYHGKLYKVMFRGRHEKPN